MSGKHWQPVQVKHFYEVMRDFSVNNQIDVTDNTWKGVESNFVLIYEILVESHESWRWETEQLWTKFKNIMTDFAKIKADNLQTGTIYKRVSSGMIALEELVPQASPIRGKQNVDSNKGINEDFTSETSQQTK